MGLLISLFQGKKDKETKLRREAEQVEREKLFQMAKAQKEEADALQQQARLEEQRQYMSPTTANFGTEEEREEAQRDQQFYKAQRRRKMKALNRKALGVFRALSSLDHAGAKVQFAVCLNNGFGVRKDVPRAMELLSTLADQGNAEAALQVGRTQQMPQMRIIRNQT